MWLGNLHEIEKVVHLIKPWRRVVMLTKETSGQRRVEWAERTVEKRVAVAGKGCGSVS